MGTQVRKSVFSREIKSSVRHRGAGRWPCRARRGPWWVGRLRDTEGQGGGPPGPSGARRGPWRVGRLQSQLEFSALAQPVVAPDVVLPEQPPVLPGLRVQLLQLLWGTHVHLEQPDGVRAGIRAAVAAMTPRHPGQRQRRGSERQDWVRGGVWPESRPSAPRAGFLAASPAQGS